MSKYLQRVRCKEEERRCALEREESRIASILPMQQLSVSNTAASTGRGVIDHRKGFVTGGV